MIERFWSLLADRGPAPRVLECGTRRWGERATGQRAALLARIPGAVHVGTDAVAGDDVDWVADLHDLSGVAAVGGPFDAIFCCSVLEHVRRPWEVARQLAVACRANGLLLVQSHQSFPLHAYPADYFRFSADALKELFHRDIGWEALSAGHRYPCKVVPLDNVFTHASDWNFEAEAFLNSWILCRRLP